MSCFQDRVLPAQKSYLEKMEAAKGVYVFFKKHHIPLVKRSKNLVSVKDCPDKEEALLRLAFQAVEQGFNALIEANLVSKKVFVNAYQSLNWNASAYPAEIRAESLEENRLKAKKDQPLPELIRKKKK